MLLKIDEYPQLRFCRIQKGTKKPFEENWPDKPYTWSEVQQFLDKECYGVLCGFGDLAVIDADKPELQAHIEKILPETFRVRTGSGGVHNYYFVKGLPKKIIMETKLLGTEVSWHWGEVQWKGQQVLGPGSLHPSGKTYEPINDLPIVELSVEQLYSALKPFMKEMKEVEITYQQEQKDYGSAVDDLSVASVWGLGGLTERNGEYYGPHPCHGSETGMNFWINPGKNLWHCFRCDSGGGPLSAIAVKEGIISCSDAVRGGLRGEKAIEALIKAKNKYGLKDDYKMDLQTLPLQTQEEKIEPITDEELGNYEEPKINWLIQNLIKPKSVTILGGKRSTLKSWLCLNLANCVASGNKFLETFDCQQGNVLYLDRENGLSELKNRRRLIRTGLGFNGETTPIFYISEKHIKIDNKKDSQRLKEIIKERQIKLLIVDAYRRVISFDENDANEVSKMFIDTLKPICDETGVAVVFIHHERKGQGEGDDMDMLRGSSDLANYVDGVIQVERKGHSLIVKHTKSRSGKEIDPFQVKVETDEIGYFKFTYKGSIENMEEKVSKCLIEWLTRTHRNKFTYSEGLRYVESLAFSASSYKRGLEDMQNKGIIIKGDGKRSYYEVAL